MPNYRWRNYISRSKKKALSRKKLTKAEKISRIPAEEMSKKSADELRGYLKTLQTGYKRRVGSFKRKGLVSYAQIAFEESYKSRRPISEMSRNQLLMGVVAYSKFFNEMTSTEKGIKLVNLEQDLRLFGTDERGRPLRVLSTKEREKFWRLYDKYKNENKAEFYSAYSEKVQQVLADLDFTSVSDIQEEIDKLFAELTKRVQQELDEENVNGRNVHSGRGPFVK